jgi:predicted enzyme related to lactoylglutathione lyase
MAKVLGIGGIFFKSPDPARLLAWYKQWLGIDSSQEGGANFLPKNMPANSLTVWSAFPADAGYFAPSGKDYMFNLIVDDLEEALRQVLAGGAQLVGEPQTYDYGKFGWFIDPDGNKVELWQP